MHFDALPDALPAAGQSAVWKYRAIHLLDDEMIGQWSTTACISVMGA